MVQNDLTLSKTVQSCQKFHMDLRTWNFRKVLFFWDTYMLWIVYLCVIPASLQNHNTQIEEWQISVWYFNDLTGQHQQQISITKHECFWTRVRPKMRVKYKLALKNMLLVHRLLWLRSEQWLLLWWLGLLDHLLLPTPLPSHTASALAGRWSCRWVWPWEDSWCIRRNLQCDAYKQPARCRGSLSGARAHVRGSSPMGVGQPARPAQGS